MFRKDINGLRATAVIVIVVMHFNIESASLLNE